MQEHGCIFLFVSTCVIGKDPISPNLRPMASNANTLGSKEGLGSRSIKPSLPNLLNDLLLRLQKIYIVGFDFDMHS